MSIPSRKDRMLHFDTRSTFHPASALLLAAATVVSACGGDEEVPSAVIVPAQPYTFVSSAGDTVQAERGEIWVPENRADPESRSISLVYVRFPSTSENPASPIVYLAGGPSGSGIVTARGARFPLFMALRQIADVIAFDQRGTGESNDIPNCATELRPPLDGPASLDVMVPLMREAAAECHAFWEAEGVDIAGYNTLESARDLDALRRALDTRRITLWGISYGTHLAMAAAKELGGRIDRMVLASAEGLDQTVKLPARTDAYLGRLEAAIAADPAAAAAFPEVTGMMRRVLGRLGNEPARVTVPAPEGSESGTTFVMGAEEVQLYTGFLISDPARAFGVLRLYQTADAGDYAPMARLLYATIRAEPISMRGMPEAMDVASGISEPRLAEWERQAETALLGGGLNFPMPWLRGAFDGLDLGPEFRERPESDTPVLLLSGTLDGRTYPESQLEATAGLSNRQHVVIENAGHNLFMVSPEVTQTILAFLRGEDVDGRRLRVDLPPAGG